MKTRLTELFGLSTPIALAPMAMASGGALTAACAKAGALALLGGGYADLAWTQREYRLACQLASNPEQQSRIGCGFISWKLAEDASALDWVLDQARPPSAMMLSFGDPRPFAQRIAATGAKLICQIQRLDQLPLAIEAGAHIIVAQGSEAGGHGMNALNGRSSLTLVPEIADWLATHSPHTLLLAAGGVADGRGLAAVLLLGADGALVGTRLWASQESLGLQGAKELAVASSGDGTVRSRVFDILRQKNWPQPYDFRTLRNALHRQWEERIAELEADPTAARADYEEGARLLDFSRLHTTVGEAVGLVHNIPTAAELIERMNRELDQLLNRS
ncbi:MAG: nitronate monooxygenase [Burkholderiaceae bacterium]